MNYKQLNQSLLILEAFATGKTDRQFKVIRQGSSNFVVYLVQGNLNKIVAIIRDHYLKIYEEELFQRQMQVISEFSEQSLEKQLSED